MHMRTFDLFEHATMGYKAVKRGFSWPAFFVTVFWAFAMRLWQPGIIGLSLVVIIVSVPGLAEFEQRSFGNYGLGLVIGLLFGFKGNEWKREGLEARGWHHAATVEASNASEAIALKGQKHDV
jgi:hypothetical protein